MTIEPPSLFRPSDRAAIERRIESLSADAPARWGKMDVAQMLALLHGLGAILVTSPEGHVLIDGGLPESAPLIMANVRALGFRVEDVKVILNSHAHYDHAGGVAALQRVHRVTGGNPRLINLLCDRTLVAGYSAQASTIEPALVDRVATGLRLEPSGGVADTLLSWMRRRVAAL